MKLIGQKINLRKLRSTDAQSIYQNINNKDVMRYLLTPSPYYLSDAKKFITRTQKKWRNDESYCFGIEDKASGEIIGAISLRNINKSHKFGELGYWLGRKYQRQGIMSDALSIILDFSFYKLNFNCVLAGTFKENVASASLLKKFGFSYIGVMKKMFFRNRRWHDDLRWQLLKENYKK